MTLRLPTLLAIEDDPSIVELLTALAAPAGMEVVAAQTLTEAHAVLEKIRPALIVLDLVLPDGSGFVVLENVRLQREFDDVPVVILSAVGDASSVKRGYALGAFDYVTKPFNVDVLEAKLRVYGRMGRLAGELDVRARERAARSFAHEVRNPLTAISAAAQILGQKELAPAVRVRMGRAIESEAHRVTGLVREYVEREIPPPLTHTVDMRELLEEVIEINLLGSRARERISLGFEPQLPRVRADPARLKQVVINLILNAVAATDRGGAIDLNAAIEGDGVALIVHDTGHGIAPGDLPRIFDESFTTRHGGDGLGLPLARRIVEEHGGAVRVESVTGQGTTFVVWLPAG